MTREKPHTVKGGFHWFVSKPVPNVTKGAKGPSDSGTCNSEHVPEELGNTRSLGYSG